MNKEFEITSVANNNAYVVTAKISAAPGRLQEVVEQVTQNIK